MKNTNTVSLNNILWNSKIKRQMETWLKTLKPSNDVKVSITQCNTANGIMVSVPQVSSLSG